MADCSVVLMSSCAVVALWFLRWSRRRRAPLATPGLPAIQAPEALRNTKIEEAGSAPGLDVHTGPEEEGQHSCPLPTQWQEDCPADVQQLIASVPELRALYATLGYAPDLERQATQLVDELIALINTEIPDFAAFYRVVHHTQTHLKESPPTSETPARLLHESARQACAGPLWQSVLAAGQDQTRILALLNRDPVHEQLPFIEQIPFYTDGKIVWRTPVEVTMLRKRPKDAEQFVHRLDALAALFAAPEALLNTQAHREVQHEIARLQRDLQRPHGYLPTTLQALARKVSTCMQQSPNPTVRCQREALDRFLTACISVRRTYGCGAAAEYTLSAASLGRFREAAQQQAQYYLHTTWMHTPWLTLCVLTTLFDSDLAALSAARQHISPASVSMLTLIRAEVASGRYDHNETIRRLRQQEAQGVYVHSLVYPLLRLHRTLATVHPPQLALT